jgi:hypothetical protein
MGLFIHGALFTIHPSWYCSSVWHYSSTPTPVLFSRYCSSTVGSLPRAVTMPDDTKAAALRAHLMATDLEQTATAARQRVPSLYSSSFSPVAASQLVPTVSLTYEDTVIAEFHLQVAAVLNVHQLVNIILDPSSPSVVMPSNIVTLSTANAEVLKQRLDALVIAVEVGEEKATTARRRVLVARQLLDEEQAAAADLERQATTKKLVPRSTSSSTTETTTASLSYVDIIVANLHIQADTMMEEIHLDTFGPAATPTAFYSNKTLSAPLLLPLAPPRPPSKNNGSGPGNGNDNNNNRHRNNNRHNGGSGGKNNDNGGNRGGNTSSNTTVVSHGATTNNGRGPQPWLTYVNPSQGHIVMYLGPSPTGQQWTQAFMATTGPYTLPDFVPGQ